MSTFQAPEPSLFPAPLKVSAAPTYRCCRPVFNLGNDSAATLTLTSSARIRANGGAPAGAAGSIALDPTGTGGTSNTNLVEQAGRVLETFNGAGTNTSNVTRD